MTSSLKQMLVVGVAAALAIPVSVRAAFTVCLEESPPGKKVKKEILRETLRNVGRRNLKKANVAKQVFDTTYSATRAVINSPTYYKAGVAIIDGIQNDKAWAVAGTEVECFGLRLDSGVGVNSASARDSQACSFHKSHAGATVQVSRGFGADEDYVNVVGDAYAPNSWLLSPEAHWLGMGGVGDKLVIDSDVLDIVEKIREEIIDPTPHASWLDGQASSTEGTDQLTNLYNPAGASVLTRVYLPKAGGADYYLYYEAEVTGFLSVMDIDAEFARDVFGIEMIRRADFYNPSGDITQTLEGAQVTPLSSADFQYYDTVVNVDGTDLNAFGFALRNYDLSFHVPLPSDRDAALPLLIDMEVLAGSRAAGIPEPGALTACLGACTLIQRRRRK